MNFIYFINTIFPFFILPSQKLFSQKKSFSIYYTNDYRHPNLKYLVIPAEAGTFLVADASIPALSDVIPAFAGMTPY